MELNTHICTQLVENAKSFTQITLDDDYIVKDNKPDVIRIIYSKGNILVEDTRAGNQALWVTGKLRFSTLYQSDDENHRLESVVGEIPFQEKIIMDEGEDGDGVTVDMQIEDLSVGIINSRKLVVRAVVNVSAKSISEQETSIACAISEDAGYEQKVREFPILCLAQNVRDKVRIPKEMILPNSRTNIGEIIFYQVDFHNEEVFLQDDRIMVQMDAQLWMLYRSESTGEYECYETVVPISGEVDCSFLQGDEIFWAKIDASEVEVEPRSDYDGESRMVGMDIVLSVEAQIYREEMCEMLQDAYSLEKELVLQRNDTTVNQLLIKNVSKVRLMEQEQLEPNQERILQICGSSGAITIDRVQKREDGLMIEGILNVHILYNTTDDTMPFAHASSQIEFEQFVEIEGLTENSLYWMNEKIEQLQVNLMDNTEYEIKAVIEISVFAVKRENLSNIVSIDAEELDMETLQKQPGMIGCVRREGEDLWDIAKKYHATPENIIEIGNKVLVVKRVC